MEGTPNTMRYEKIAALKVLGVNRLSSGIQTWNPEELKRVGRPYPMETAYQSVQEISDAGFHNFNLDLIYGLEGQTSSSWKDSLETTVGLKPTTITIYPVVVRPLTGIQKRQQVIGLDEFMENKSKYDLYDESVDYLTKHGYHQNTLVRFTKLQHDGYMQEENDFGGIPLIGLGAGSRSYINSVHYGTDFAVRKKATLGIINGFIEHQHSPDNLIEFGFILNDDEKKRRYIMLNLSLGRVSVDEYRGVFSSELLSDFPDELAALQQEDTVEINGNMMVMTKKGLKYSSAIARLFYSESVIEKENAYNPK